jgi:hypothetical protein
LLQAFPNKDLAVLWNFKRLQGFQTSFDGFQIFHSGRRLSAAFWALSRCIQLPRAVGSMAVSRSHGFAVRYGGGRVHGAVIRIDRIFNLAVIQVFGKLSPTKDVTCVS